MLPMIMRLRVQHPGRRSGRRWLPVSRAWILLAALLIVLLPFLLLGALFSAGRGPGFRLLLIYPLLAVLVWNLGGLVIDVNQKKSALSIDFI